MYFDRSKATPGLHQLPPHRTRLHAWEWHYARQVCHPSLPQWHEHSGPETQPRAPQYPRFACQGSGFGEGGSKDAVEKRREFESVRAHSHICKLNFLPLCIGPISTHVNFLNECRRLFNWLTDCDTLLIEALQSLLCDNDEDNYRILVYLFDKQSQGCDKILKSVLVDIIRSEKVLPLKRNSRFWLLNADF